jgi:hypothetical protein
VADPRLLCEDYFGRAALVMRTEEGDRLLGTVVGKLRPVFEVAAIMVAAGIRTEDMVRWVMERLEQTR